jgi:osmotically-inducible protein OsmY
MANYDRYRGSQQSNYGNREEDRERYSRKDYNQNQSQYDNDYGNTDDYDRRRDFGNTSSYGNTSDNNRRFRRYDEDWNDYNNRMSNYGNRSQGNYGGNYGSSQYNRQNDYNNQYGNTGSGYSSGYGGSSSYGQSSYGNSGAGNYGYGQQYRGNRGYDEDFNEDYGTGSYGYGNRYNRDRDRDYNSWSNRQNRDRDWWDKTKDEVSSWFGDDEAERRRRMDRRMAQHRGRGPKGYTRSDERIREDINDRMSEDAFLDATEIEVTVSNGEVTLTGTVDNRIDKRRAEDLAEDISGVKNVQNQLRVKQTSSSAINGLKNEYQG